jgi:hypothetical protein
MHNDLSSCLQERSFIICVVNGVEQVKRGAKSLVNVLPVQQPCPSSQRGGVVAGLWRKLGGRGEVALLTNIL